MNQAKALEKAWKKRDHARNLAYAKDYVQVMKRRGVSREEAIALLDEADALSG